MQINELNALFSMIIVCNRDLEIVSISEPLQQYLPDIEMGAQLTEEFKFTRPASIKSVSDIEKLPKSLFLLVAKNQQFALRGQMLCTELDKKNCVVFLGSPWLIWLSTNQPDINLGLRDFSAGDAQMDQLIYISTKKQMVDDLEKLNQELIVAKKEVEAAQEEKNVFYAQMSHEMRTPLNGVVSALTLLAEETLPQHARDLVDMASRSSENLLKVINYVLDVARLETGHLDDEPENFGLKTLLKSTMEIVRPQIIDSNIRVVLKVDKNLPDYYLGLKDRLHQVILNLLSNAIKFTHHGYIEINVLFSNKPNSSTDQTNNIRFEVSDSGVGIPTNMLEKIFQPFYTTAPNGQSTLTGTGLGLDIVRRNVNVLGGKLGVESRLGEGSLFWLEIPLTIGNAPLLPEQVFVHEPTEKARVNGHVMLVEDNETNRLLCTVLLQGLGVTVITQDSAESALETLVDDKPDLIFMDIGLPGMNGHDATVRVRERYSKEELPIIALTAYTNIEEHEKSVTAGMNDYLVKPVSKKRFKECLLQWLPSKNNVDVDSVNVKPKIEILENLEQQIGIENLKLVIYQFNKDALLDIEKLKQAEDPHQQAKIAHSFISTCDSFALPELAIEFRRLEDAIQENVRIAPNVVTKLCHRLQLGVRALQTYIASK